MFLAIDLPNSLRYLEFTPFRENLYIKVNKIDLVYMFLALIFTHSVL